MAKIKSYTDLEQSKKLAEFLPLESADGFWEYHDKWYSEGDEWEGYEDYPRAEPYLEYTRKENEWKEDKSDVPCWSLTALLKLIPKHILRKDKIHCGQAFIPSFRWEITPTAIYYTDGGGVMDYVSFRYGDNNIELIDAVFKMVIKLHEQKLL